MPRRLNSGFTQIPSRNATLPCHAGDSYFLAALDQIERWLSLFFASKAPIEFIGCIRSG